MEQRQALSNRRYSGQLAEERKVDNRKDMEVLQGLRAQLKEDQNYMSQQVHETRSHNRAMEFRGSKLGQAEDVKKQDKGSGEVINNTAPPTSILYEDNGAAVNKKSIDTEFGITKGHEEHGQDQTQSVEDSDSDPVLFLDGNSISGRMTAHREGDFDHGERVRDHEDSQKDETRKWVPLEMDGPTDVLQSTLDMDQHSDQQVDFDLDAESRTIYILGTGPSGKYVAQALASLPEAPPVTLLMHTPLLMQQWHEEGARIQLLRNGKLNTASNLNIESSSHIQRTNPAQRFPGFGDNLECSAEPPDTVINFLIVTTEGHTTIAALSSIKHRLKRTSTICFVQDGLGITDLVDSSLFPDPDLRPNYMLGSMSHDLVATSRKFTLYEKQPGKMYLTIARRNQLAQEPNGKPQIKALIKRIDYSWAPTSTHLMRTLGCAYELGAVGLSETKFYEMQLQKLAVNAVIGPLSVIYDCFNDELLCNYQVSRSMMLMLKEISAILRRLPEVSRSSKKESCFGPEKLRGIVVGVLGKTGKNSTKMREAVRKGERTDVEFYNGYLLKRAAELQIDCPHLEMTLALVKGKQAMKSKERNLMIPFKV